MNYALDSYGNFDEEQFFLESVLRKKEDHEAQIKIAQVETDFRFSVIKGYFTRLSWKHKKCYILDILRVTDFMDVLLKVIYFISRTFGKLSAYADSLASTVFKFDQIWIDHDRMLDVKTLKETISDDIEWIKSQDETKQLRMLQQLICIGGGGLARKLYIPLLAMHNRKVVNFETTTKENIVSAIQYDDGDKYPANHPANLEVERLRKKWDEIVEKYKQELQNPENKKTDKKKANKKEKEQVNSEGDWLEALPIWIVKKIFSYLDQKTLSSIKKVSSYWAYASDSVIKDRQARKAIDAALAKMSVGIDITEFDDTVFYKSNTLKPDRYGEKRMMLLNCRGAATKTIAASKSKISKIKKDCVSTSLITDLPEEQFFPFDQMTVFPRVVNESTVLYKDYPCALRDVNIIFDVENDIPKKRNTLVHTFSEMLSDVISLSEADLSSW